jgi:glycosyltransferase involved in cell wall biosynthesis
MIHDVEEETRLNAVASTLQRQPRVAQIIETLTMGGAENLAVRIANGLALRGYESHLVVVTGPGVLSSLIDPAVKVHYLGFERCSIKQPIQFIRSLIDGRRRLGTLLSSKGIELAQTHLPGANFLGLLLTFGSVVRVVPTVHNNREFDYGEKSNFLLLGLRKWAYKSMVTRCAGVVAVSAAVKASLKIELGTREKDAKRIHVVTNGVSLPGPLSDDEKSEIRARYGVGKDTVLVLSAGRLSDQKNFSDLIKVASRIRDRGRDIHFVVAGEGPLLAHLESEIASQNLSSIVTLAGNVSDLDRVMSTADIFVSTSLWEGLPLVLLEAMAAELPPVGYAIDGIDEILTDGVQGRVVPISDVQAMADSLDSMIQRPDDRKKFGSSSRRLVKEKYNFEMVLDRLASVYSAVLKSNA